MSLLSQLRDAIAQGAYAEGVLLVLSSPAFLRHRGHSTGTASLRSLPVLLSFKFARASNATI